MRMANTSVVQGRRRVGPPLPCGRSLPYRLRTTNPSDDSFSDALSQLKSASAALLELLAATTAEDWERSVAHEGCTLRDRATLLAYLDDATLLSLTNPTEFRRERASLPWFGEDLVACIRAQHRHLSPQTVLAWVADSRHQLLSEYRNHGPRDNLLWFTGDTTVGESIIDRLMDSFSAQHFFAEPTR